jgi:hypothetical protein
LEIEKLLSNSLKPINDWLTPQYPMNEGNSGAAPVESTPAYKDRSAGLVIFGILGNR